MSETTTVSVKILDKEYQVACPAEEVDALTASARYVDQQMSEIRESGKVFGVDRIAVMAALNIANEHLRTSRSVAAAAEIEDTKVTSLTQRLTRVLAEHKQLNL